MRRVPTKEHQCRETVNIVKTIYFFFCKKNVCGGCTDNIVFFYVQLINHVVVVVDLPLLRVAVEGFDNPVSLEKLCQASLPPDQQWRHSLGRQPEVQYIA